MSARRLRRRFDVPFVVTLASCTPAKSEDVRVPPRPAVQQARDSGTAPAPDGAIADADFAMRWRVTRRGDTCSAPPCHENGPKVQMSCNPPSPQPRQVPCPPGLADGKSVMFVLTDLSKRSECTLACPPEGPGCTLPGVREIVCP